MESYGSEWLLWWVGDAMGALIVAPLILVWSTNPLRSLDRRRLLEGGLLLVALVGLSVFVFLAGYWRYPHLIFPVLVWTTLRFRQPGAVTGSFIVTAIAIAGAVDGSIPLADRSDTEIVEILEGLLAGLAEPPHPRGGARGARQGGSRLQRSSARRARRQLGLGPRHEPRQLVGRASSGSMGSNRSRRR